MVLGIDLGSEFSKVALVKPGVPFEIMHNVQSKRKTRSAVAFYKGERMFAGDAEGLLTRKPQFVLVGGAELLGVNVSHSRARRALDRVVTVQAINDEERGGAALVLPKHRDTNPETEEIYSAEELVAQYLAHLKDFSETHADGRIRDVVLTVPSYYTQSEKRALLRAADLADLKVLSLADEITAAAVQFSIDRVYTNETRKVLFVNVGAGATEAAVVEFSSYRKLGKDASLGRVTAKAWDELLSSSELDNAMADILADAFNKKHGANLEGDSKDIRDYLRPMQKIRKRAGKVVEILSANEEIPVTIESLTPSVDFRHHVTRNGFIEAVTPILDRVGPLIADVLREGNYTVDDIDDVEVLGGGVRVPAIQERLRSVLATSEGGKRTLGVRLNGDEAMALGSAFIAANISTAFKVRHVGMVDTTPFAIGARVVEMPPKENETEAADGETEEGTDAEKEATAADEEAEEEAPKKAWQRRASLYRKYDAYGRAKRISFHHDKDLIATLHYEASARLPEGSSRLIGRYNVTGVEDLVKGELAHLGTPKVTLHFKLTRNGMSRLSRAEAQWEETYFPSPSPTPTPTPEATPETTPEAASEDGSEGESDETEKEGADSGGEGEGEGRKLEEKEEAGKEGGETDEKAEDATEGEEKSEAGDKEAASGEEKDGEESEAEPTPSPTPEAKTRTIRRPLRVTEDFSALAVKPLAGKAFEAARARLLRLAKADNERKERQRAKNNLETLIYAVREKTMDREEDFQSVTSEEQRSELSELLEAARDWLDEDGEDVGQTETAEYTKRSGGIRSIADAAWARYAEEQARPKALGDAKAAVEKLSGIVGSWSEEKPWITEVATEVASGLVSDLSKWIEEKVVEQEGKEAHEEPAFTARQLKAQVAITTKSINRTNKTPKPTPTPSPSAEAEAEGEGEGAAEGASKAADEEGKSGEGEEDAAKEEGTKAEGEAAEEAAAEGEDASTQADEGQGAAEPEEVEGDQGEGEESLGEGEKSSGGDSDEEGEGAQGGATSEEAELPASEEL